MLRLEKSITVHAPVRAVFAYVDAPANLPEIWPALYDVKGVKTLPNGGHDFEFDYNFAGTKVRGTTSTSERVEERRLIDKATGDVEATFSWKFYGENGSTKVELEAEYELPKTLERDLSYVKRHSEIEAETILENLKARLEA